MQKCFLRGLSVAAASLFALSAHADANGPKVTMAGNLAVNAFAAQQKVRTDRSTTLATSGELRAEVTAKAKNGVNYGMVGAIDLDNTATNRIKKAYLVMNHEKYGDWLLGDADSASSLMIYDGADIMAGLQGPTSSSFDKVINVTGGVSMKNNMATKASSATKLTYLSPIKDGFRVGFSFTPSEAFTGTATRTNKVSTTNSKGAYVSGGTHGIYAVNVLEGALSYSHQLNAGGKTADVNWYLGGKMARSKATNAVPAGNGINPVRAMQAGVVVDYGDYQIGGGYYNNGRSYMRKSPQTKNWTNTEGFNVAFGKKLDSIPGAYVSLGQTSSRRRVTQGYARGNVTSLGADYDVAKGLVVYTSVDMFDLKSPKAHQNAIGTATQYDYLDNSSSSNTNNRGALFVVGTKLRF